MQFQKKPYKRHVRLSKQIKIICSNFILRDFTLEGRGVITITKVKVTSDLGSAKIYYSVIDNSISKKDLNINLNKKSKFVKGIIGRRITSKKIPDITFCFDDSIEFYDKIDKIFSKMKNEQS